VTTTTGGSGTLVAPGSSVAGGTGAVGVGAVGVGLESVGSSFGGSGDDGGDPGPPGAGGFDGSGRGGVDGGVRFGGDVLGTRGAGAVFGSVVRPVTLDDTTEARRRAIAFGRMTVRATRSGRRTTGVGAGCTSAILGTGVHRSVGALVVDGAVATATAARADTGPAAVLSGMRASTGA
jgi:hypothetical protein